MWQSKWFTAVAEIVFISCYSRTGITHTVTHTQTSLMLQPHWHNTHTHTNQFNDPLSGTTRVSWYQKGKTSLDSTESRDSEWQWHQLGHMQVCTSLQTDNHASTPPLSSFTGRMPFLSSNQQHQSTEGQSKHWRPHWHNTWLYHRDAYYNHQLSV